MRDGSLEGIALVERQQRMLAEGHSDGLVLERQHVDSPTEAGGAHL